MATLTHPLTEEQQLLIDIVWTTFVEHARFPNFFYVNYLMCQQGHDAAKILYSFPGIGNDLEPCSGLVDRPRVGCLV
ncbi:hypothetical protein SAMN06272735_9253 [Streptomyces sp. TLI_55]|uniref:hypothetical protein n=1 Tax=Streptomyces sp. TLI_55 TaxID=1938861 RepID=UPI000BC530BC|nr:hypothetical protein [Streptomyces sp. TLI_55]SNX88751.1 hypothetical protein SAMN06272735_9253 [Streptomyces sp. TLI_55]